MPVSISTGKLRRLRMLSDPLGRFKMMAIDQRGALISQLAQVTHTDAKAVPYDAVARTKATITRALSPYATALLTDPIYGYPYSAEYIPGSVALLLAYEETGYDKSGPDGRERTSRLIDGWSVQKAARVGADAIKLLLYYHPDAGQETLTHQQELIRRVGRECADCELPFLLELVAYSLDGASTDSAEFARQKPDLVIRSAAEFSKAEYGVDILKLEFPCNLKFTKELSHGIFDGKEREPVYSLDEVRDRCHQLDDASGLPWVILSAGVGIDEFLENVRLACDAGASGFLCGRAIWSAAVDLYPDLDAVAAHLHRDGAYNFIRCNAYAERALPWYDHRRFGGLSSIEIEGLSPDWYRR